MSASEKLKARFAEIASYGYDCANAPSVPSKQLLAVVEAAEGIEGELPIDQGCHDMLYCAEFRAALTALDEALSGGTVRDSKLTDRFDWNSRDGVTFDAGES